MGVCRVRLPARALWLDEVSGPDGRRLSMNKKQIAGGMAALVVVNVVSILVATFLMYAYVKHEVSSALEDQFGASGSSSDTSPFAGQSASWEEPGFFDSYEIVGGQVGAEADVARTLQGAEEAMPMDGVPEDFDWRCSNASLQDLRANGLQVTAEEYEQGMSHCH